MKNPSRPLLATALALLASLAAFGGVASAKKPEPSPSPSASPSASPAPLPTATPEPPALAIPRLEAKLKATPNDKDAQQQLAGYYLSEGKPDKAKELTQKLLAGGVKTAQVYYTDGLANEALGRVPEATADFESATNQEPTNAQILLTLTNLYLQTNRAADAERVAKRATTFNPTDTRVFENYGLVLAQAGKYDDARTQFEAAAKLDPKDAAPVVLEARSYVSQKAFALAGSTFDRALGIDPKSPDALLGRANVYVAGHDVKNAIDTFEKLLAVEPNDDAKAAVLITEYQTYRDEKIMDQALATLKRAEAAYPNVAAVHLANGDYLVSFGKDQKGAEAEWKSALGPKNDNPDALDRLGRLAIAQNKRGEAVGYFKRLTEAAPSDPGAWATLADVYLQGSQFNEARDAFRRSFELQRTPQALAGMGTSDLQLKNYKECDQIFTAIDRNAPDFMKANPQLLYPYAKCLAGAGDRAGARTAYGRLKALVKPGSPIAGEIDKAIALLGSTPKSTVKAASKPSPKPQASAKPH